jgi:hypothetical protein
VKSEVCLNVRLVELYIFALNLMNSNLMVTNSDLLRI